MTFHLFERFSFHYFRFRQCWRYFGFPLLKFLIWSTEVSSTSCSICLTITMLQLFWQDASPNTELYFCTRCSLCWASTSGPYFCPAAWPHNSHTLCCKSWRPKFPPEAPSKSVSKPHVLDTDLLLQGSFSCQMHFRIKVICKVKTKLPTHPGELSGEAGVKGDILSIITNIGVNNWFPTEQRLTVSTSSVHNNTISTLHLYQWSRKKIIIKKRKNNLHYSIRAS